MKTFFRFLVLSLCMFVCPSVANADKVTVTENGVVYLCDTETSTAEVYSVDQSLEAIVLPSSVEAESKICVVTGIGELAFDECTALKSVTVPETVNRIGVGAFYGCSSLASIVIPEGVTNIESHLFYGCRSLASVQLPSTVKSIASYAFCNCVSLFSLELPENLATIDDYAFYNDQNLTTLTCRATTVPECKPDAFFTLNNAWCVLYVPSEVVGKYRSADVWNTFFKTNAIGDTAEYPAVFVDGVEYILNPNTLTAMADWGSFTAESLTVQAKVESDGTSYTVTDISSRAFNGRSALKSLTVADGVVRTGTLFCMNCSALASVEIPESVTEMGSGAFYYCSSLETAKLPSGMTKILSNMFYGCSQLASIAIPEGVTSVGEKAFYNCGKLSSAELPSVLTEIGTMAFCYCTSLQTVSIPESVKAIGQSAFQNCTALVSAEIKAKELTSIAAFSFAGCTALASVVLPSGITDIDSYAFADCLSLAKITCCAEVPPSCFNAQEPFGLFSQEVWDRSKVEVCVPKGTADAYRSAVGWDVFSIFTDMQETAVDRTVGGTAVEKARYSLGGTPLSTGSKGVNIVRMSDGTVRKVVVR